MEMFKPFSDAGLIKTPCTVCGGTDFTADVGFFFCTECHTQSQDIREEVFDEYFGTQKATTKKLLKKKDSKGANTDEGEKVQLTSWEVLNYVMKGLVDELISMGASVELRTVALQLWASYLRRLEVAFTSVEVERKPKLGFVFNKSDAELVYGLSSQKLKEKNWRRRKSRSKSSASSGSETDTTEDATATKPAIAGPGSRRSVLLRLARRKRALASAEYSNMSQGSSKSFNQTLESLDSSDGSQTPKRMKLTKHARSLLSSSCDESSHRKLIKNEQNSLRNITKTRVVALVCLALRLSRQNILTSDLIRWVDEGHISLGRARRYLPANMQIDYKTHRLIEIEHISYVNCQSLVDQLCRELGVQDPPTPDTDSLTDRYCLELQLPDAVATSVKALLRLSVNCHASRYHEVRVMSAIIVVLKMFFSLDDCTEYRLSQTAAEVNQARSSEDADSCKSFVWSSWVQFIQCRAAVLAGCSQTVRTALFGDLFGSDRRLFLQHVQQTMADESHQAHFKISQKYTLDQAWVSSLCRCLQKISEVAVKGDREVDGAEAPLLLFPASLTPLHSSTQILLAQHADWLTPAVQDLLQEDYTKQSLEYILDPERFVTIGLTHDFNIIQPEKAAANFKVGKILTRKRDALPRFKLNQVNITVNLVDNLKNDTAEFDAEENETDNRFMEDLKEIISDDSDEEDHEVNIDEPTLYTNLELFKAGSQYWFSHFNLSKSLLSQDEFEQLAMREFPSSFWWLLNECARMTCVATKELYTNVVAIEAKYQHILTNAGRQGTSRKRKRI